jgi:diacylglycerol O-acyltransferase
MRQLSMTDAMFVLMEQPQRSSNHIGMIFIFDPSTADQPVTFERLMELYEKRIPLARVFREKLVRVPLDLDYPYWINDKDFDLEFHVRHTGLPRPGTRKQFFAVVNRLMSLQLDMSRPLWETYFIEGLDAMEGVPPGSFALLFKMHHAAVDGVSGMEMVTALLESDEAAQARMPKKPWKGEEPPEQRKLLVKALGASWAGPLKLTGALVKALPSIADNRKRQRSGEVVKPGKAKPPKTRFNGQISPHRVLEGRSWPFAEVKRMKDAVPGATINDVVVTVVSGALRSYLQSKNELPEESLVASIPISIRTEEERGTGGNQVSMTFIKLHTDIANPMERLAAVRGSMREVKDYNKAVDARSLVDTTQAMPGMLMGLAMRAMPLLPTDAPRLSNTFVTNVPGPQTPMTMMGARYIAGFGTGPSNDGFGLFHIITSLSGILSIGFNADREMMPDSEFYAECIENAFNELREAIAARPPASDLPQSAAGGGERKAAKDNGAMAKAPRKRKPSSPSHPSASQPAGDQPAKARSPRKSKAAAVPEG